ncbi:NnrU family protein [Aeromonas schubertii]|uniref:NnrU domain-containing protein n=1 Tax=Aeromonas schubertii TaxID=652 RepID=A0A0S2SHY2_9GAMM|nr:NnrU family protein [Aeromonas schubertii]ALP41311.1 hypothetical protein WL1483_1892 [Aeromonas schubertii]KUE78896.1 hypothetical protein ATO46_08925 [Aeromonas schubertii]QCG46835.1 hypothetical protein E2P79_02275 [Aeromonas schubertii]
MLPLTLGLLLFALLHLYPALSPGHRAHLLTRLGEQRYKGLFSLGVLVAFGLIFAGWRTIQPDPLYAPPAWGLPVAMGMLPLGVWLVCCSLGPNHVRKWLRHPQLLGFLLWALAHLLVNQEGRSLLLFGSLTLWALLNLLLIIRRDGWRSTVSQADWRADLASLVATIALLALLLLGGHQWLTGIPLLAR